MSHRSRDIVQLIHYLRMANIGTTRLIAPLALSAGGALCEGAALLLLIPTFEGILTGDLNVVRTLPFIGAVVDRFDVKGDSGRLFLLLGTTLGVSFAKVICNYLSALATAVVIRDVGTTLRKRIYDRYLAFGKLYFDRVSQGYLHQVLTEYVHEVVSALLTLHGAASALLLLVVYLVMMFELSWKLSLIVLTVFPGLHLSLTWLMRRIAHSSYLYTDSFNDLGKIISNAIFSVPLMKAYDAEERERSSFARASDRVQALDFSIERSALLVAPLQEFLLLVLVFLLIALIAFAARGEPPTLLAQYAVFLVIVRRSVATFGICNDIRTVVASVSGPLSEIRQVFDDTEKFVVPCGGEPFECLSSGIDIQHLTFSYPGGVTALRNVSFRIERGSMIALVGETGAGKTTLIHLLMRFYDVSPGSILVDGRDLRCLDPRMWRKQISLVSQDSILLNATLRENLIYGLEREVEEKELADIVSRARLSEIVSQLPRGLDTEVGERGARLSGGEKQRVSIARAMLKNGAILPFDEATSSLDSDTERLIHEALDELMCGRTSIVVAHRLSTIKHADHIVVLEEGEVVEEGNIEGLIARRGHFSRFWEAQRM